MVGLVSWGKVIESGRQSEVKVKDMGAARTIVSFGGRSVDKVERSR